eukprot:jgi/Mesvir1/27670/Mv07392-RA.1
MRRVCATSFPLEPPQPGYLKPLIPSSAPEEGEDWDTIMADVRDKIMPGVTHWQSPAFFAYFPANSSYPGLLGEMLSGALNVIGFSWISSPAATELETIALDWLGQLLRLPAEFLSEGSSGRGGGVIQGTASESTLVALLAARARALHRLREQHASSGGQEGGGAAAWDEALASTRLVAYTSDQAHSSVKKACMIAGIRHFRALPTTASTGFALSPEVLEEAVREDLQQGLLPCFLCATLGTTSSTAVDPLGPLGAIAAAHGMWTHVDAAYAGSACICPEHRHHLDGVEVTDSFCMNAHKWLLTNFDCSAMWVKDSRFLLQALSLQPEFLRNKASDAGVVVDYKDWQVPLGRRFRALKLWFVMRSYGAKGLRRYIRSHVAMAAGLEATVTADPRFRLVAKREFALVCFCLRARGAGGGANDSAGGGAGSGNEEEAAINRALLDAVNATGKLFLTHTVIGGVYSLRMAIGGARVTQEDVDAAWSVISAEADKLLAQRAA